VGEPSLWHLAEILSWFGANTTVKAPPAVFEVSKVAAEINHAVEVERLKRIREFA